MEPCGVHFVLAAAGILLQASGGSAAPMQCHFDSRGKGAKGFDYNVLAKRRCLFQTLCVIAAVCVFEGRHYSMGDTWMDNTCMQCTCLHPIGVGCCETYVYKQLFFLFIIALQLILTSLIRMLYSSHQPQYSIHRIK